MAHRVSARLTTLGCYLSPSGLTAARHGYARLRTCFMVPLWSWIFFCNSSNA
jgi:hypothetical protein